MHRWRLTRMDTLHPTLELQAKLNFRDRDARARATTHKHLRCPNHSRIRTYYQILLLYYRWKTAWLVFLLWLPPKLIKILALGTLIKFQKWRPSQKPIRRALLNDYTYRERANKGSTHPKRRRSLSNSCLLKSFWTCPRFFWTNSWYTRSTLNKSICICFAKTKIN